MCFSCFDLMTPANYFKIAPVASHAAKLGHNMTLINMSFFPLPHLYFKDDLVTSFWVHSLLTISMCKQKANTSPKSSLVVLSLKEAWISPSLLLRRLPLCSWFYGQYIKSYLLLVLHSSPSSPNSINVHFVVHLQTVPSQFIICFFHLLVYWWATLELNSIK